MLHPLLEAFLSVAEHGSFSKAAEALYLSPTAVMKQMNQLEKELGLTLLERTSRGVRLTDAGESFSRDAGFLLQYTEEAIGRARAAASKNEHVIRLGTSTLFPCNRLVDLWNRLAGEHPDFRLQLVPFDDSKMELGRQLDVAAGFFDLTGRYQPNSIPLGKVPFCIAMPNTHRLAGSSLITYEDMHGETVLIMSAGASVMNDSIRRDIETGHPEITIKDTLTHYDLSVFNECAEKGYLLLSLECWKNVHPALVTIPLDAPYAVSSGVICGDHPNEDTRLFLEIIRESLEGVQVT